MERVRLGDIANIITGNTPSTKDKKNYNGNDICLFKPSDIREEIYTLKDSQYKISEYARDKCRMFPQDSILVTCIGTIGKVAISGIEGTCNQQINVILPNYDVFFPKYLAYRILSTRAKLLLIANSPVVPIINKSNFQNIDFLLHDLLTQEKIVQELDTLNNIISYKKMQLEELDNLAQSLFHHMFGVHDFIIKKWNDIFITKTGKLDANAMVENGKYPFFTCSKEAYKIDCYAFNQKALLLAGNNATATYDVKYYDGKFNAYQRTYVLSLKDIKNNYYVFKKQLEGKLRDFKKESKGTNTRYLTMNILKDVSFIVPPIELQNQFAERVEKIQERKKPIS